MTFINIAFWVLIYLKCCRECSEIANWWSPSFCTRPDQEKRGLRFKRDQNTELNKRTSNTEHRTFQNNEHFQKTKNRLAKNDQIIKRPKLLKKNLTIEVFEKSVFPKISIFAWWFHPIHDRGMAPKRNDQLTNGWLAKCNLLNFTFWKHSSSI